ncbi:MAG: rod shape-determining protein MreD [PVC group bacterium]|nr:rod shape-determining protein MreD [PVC group bacterium]
MFKIRFRTIKFAVIAYLVLVFQASLISCISLGSVKPDLVLLLVIFFSLYRGLRQGMYCGMILGLGVDVLSGGIVGINSLILGSVGFFCGLLSDRLYKNHFLTKILVPCTASIFSIISYYILASNFYRLPLFFDNIFIIFSSIVYTSLASLVFLKFLEKQVVVKVYTLR